MTEKDFSKAAIENYVKDSLSKFVGQKNDSENKAVQKAVQSILKYYLPAHIHSSSVRVIEEDPDEKKIREILEEPEPPIHVEANVQLIETIQYIQLDILNKK
jgi:hypothetical protein